MSIEVNIELGVCGDCDQDICLCYNLGYCVYEEEEEKNNGTK